MSHRPPALFCPACASCERKARTAVLVPMAWAAGPVTPPSARRPRRGQVDGRFVEATCGRCGFREAHLPDELRRAAALETARRRSKVRRGREKG